jgi:hypothetical protein
VKPFRLNTYRFLTHDRGSIVSHQLDWSVCRLGLRILKTPPQRPQAIRGGLHHDYRLEKAA